MFAKYVLALIFVVTYVHAACYPIGESDGFDTLYYCDSNDYTDYCTELNPDGTINPFATVKCVDKDNWWVDIDCDDCSTELSGSATGLITGLAIGGCCLFVCVPLASSTAAAKLRKL